MIQLNLKLTNQSINKSILPEKQSSSSDPSLQSCTLSQRSASCKQTPSLNFYELIIFLFKILLTILFVYLTKTKRMAEVPPPLTSYLYFLVISLTFILFYHLCIIILYPKNMNMSMVNTMYKVNHI